MNFVHIAGNLGADPETRFTQTGKKVTTMRVATRTRRSGNSNSNTANSAGNSNSNEDTIWFRVTIWGDQFEKMIPHFKKGSSIMVWGELRKPEIFNDREGKPQISLEITAAHIQFSPFGKPGGSAQGVDGAHQSSSASAPNAPAAPFGSFQEGGASSPYMGGKPAGFSQGSGETFDDEVPF